MKRLAAYLYFRRVGFARSLAWDLSAPPSKALRGNRLGMQRSKRMDIEINDIHRTLVITARFVAFVWILNTITLYALRWWHA